MNEKKKNETAYCSTRTTKVENLLKQLFHSRLLNMSWIFITSYPKRAHGIIVIYHDRVDGAKQKAVKNI